MAKPSGFILYRGPSMLDGSPIVVILTGLKKRGNAKTGQLLQTWILRSDIDPLEAARTGRDSAICGACPHRGVVVRDGRRKRNRRRSCYVRLDTAPLNVFNSFKRGIYPRPTQQQARAWIGNRRIRGGSYGDPGAVPFSVWTELLAGIEPGTAYTHQWRDRPELAAFCMASVDSLIEREHAKALGFRTFRVRGQDEPKARGESVCPASAEAGKKTTCDLCRACGGLAAKAKADIVIQVHGGKGKENARAAIAAA